MTAVRQRPSQRASQCRAKSRRGAGGGVQCAEVGLGAGEGEGGVRGREGGVWARKAR